MSRLGRVFKRKSHNLINFLKKRQCNQIVQDFQATFIGGQWKTSQY